jgi:hypothetical protein
MLGQFLMVAITGLVVWKYRNSLSEYVKGNAGPAREKVDGLLRTVQQTSETLLDQAKEQISSRRESGQAMFSFDPHVGQNAASAGASR